VLRLIVVSTILGFTLNGQAAKDQQALGLALSANGSLLYRAGVELPLLLKAGDVLFEGDRLVASGDQPRLLFCPARQDVALTSDAQLTVEASQLRFTAGRAVSTTAAAICTLPSIARGSNAFRYGAALTRSIATGEFEAPPFASGIPNLPPDRRAALNSQLTPIEAALAKNPNDLAARIAKAETLASFDLSADAAEEYRKLKREVPSTSEVAGTRLFLLEDKAALQSAPAPKPDPTIGGKTYALLVGISKYQSSDIRALQFADQDAILFRDYLMSPRGGALPAADIITLLNEEATTAAIKLAFETILKKTTEKDTVILLIASHGTVDDRPESRSKGAYIVSYDADPQDLRDTALPMILVQNLIREDLKKAARVLAFIDACRSGTIGTIPEKSQRRITGQFDSLTQTELQLFLFTASKPGEVSFEGRQYGGGHGAFSFFLIRALNGDADIDSDGSVTINEMSDYTARRVAEATNDKQHPRESGTLDTTIKIADLKREGLKIGEYDKSAGPGEAGARGITMQSYNSAVRTLNIKATVDFDEALSQGRVLPDQPENAFTAFRQLKIGRQLTRDQVLNQENRLRAAIEQQGQQFLLQYLKGEQTPQTREQMISAARYYSAATQMSGDTPNLASRQTFWEGRLALAEKDYDKARELLERSVRQDPDGAYAYNALGIAYLEKASYANAKLAFGEASKRAPYWAYPLHNLALAQMQTGDYTAAIQTYDEAIKLAPAYAYLPYNQGLIYQRINRRAEAEAKFAKAIELSPELAEAYNALGTLKAESRKFDEADKLYAQALAKKPTLLEARHNQALLYSTRKERVADGIKLLQANLAASAAYLPSRISLARILQENNRPGEAKDEYRTIVASKPDFLAARLALADLESKANNLTAALTELREVDKLQPGNAEVLERIGDLELQNGSGPRAIAAYEAAEKASSLTPQKKRLRNKISKAKTT
jgi:tetratricopeptide (TPR) repeat protein